MIPRLSQGASATARQLRSLGGGHCNGQSDDREHSCYHLRCIHRKNIHETGSFAAYYRVFNHPGTYTFHSRLYPRATGVIYVVDSLVP